MNDYLVKNNYVPFSNSSLDSVESKGMKDALTKYRLLGAQSCHINSGKKYFQIYIEDGFNDQYGYYNGIIIMNNKQVCEITTSPYKLNLDSLSYTKVNDGNFVLYTKKVSMDNFKKKYLDEYLRYEIVIQNKTNDLKKCLALDEYTPKSVIYTKSYYFVDKKINNYGIVRIKYNDIKDGIEGIPYFTEEKKKSFIKCINNLNILKYQIKMLTDHKQ
ncbi:hypothetical protein ACKW6Q_09220 [Chryseobacterium kwangjuense]|uniref:Uncharacterized protein n=1 Tax=Chryseobacterium kwangjuense TaxID=267125 RepID=A0ABW9K1F3_9FLAO